MESIDNPPPSRLLCPAIRIKYKKNQSRKKINKSSYRIVDNSFYLSNLDYGESSQSHSLLPLFWCNNKEPLLLSIDDEDIDESCGACWHNVTGTTYYFCIKCDRWYHKECVESPPMFKSPYHPKHPLQLYKFDGSSYNDVECFSCGSYRTGLVYHCSTCDFNLDPVCVRKPPFINHRKRHEHTLYFYPRKFYLICDVCGLDDIKSFNFVCLQCDFLVHRSCIYLPYVIKISRHKHRLSFSYSLPSRKWSCGVCLQKIDETYGAYSCMTKDCIYGVHSRCATKPNLWDRKELEEEPEDEVVNEIKPPYEEMSDGTILHFSHPEHPMRLEEDFNIWYNEKKCCQACVLPLYDGKSYTCTRMECDYGLHMACTNLPLVLDHALHFHTLTLEASCTTERDCELCLRYSFGFKYVCHQGCAKSFILDVRCASVYEPYVHHLHQHPLFITSSEDLKTCSICGKRTQRPTLNCDGCRFVLCYGCATLPHKVRYKNDEHFLTLSCETRGNGICWCDSCEETIDSNNSWFYMCKECDVTLHVQCLLGEYIYMNPGSRIKARGKEFSIVPNSSLTRPICSGCRNRCKDRMVFVASSGEIYCSTLHT